MRERSCLVGPITVTSKSTTASSSSAVPSTAMSSSSSVAPSTAISSSSSVAPSTAMSSSSSVAPSTAMSSSSSVAPSTAISLTTVLTSTAKLQKSKEMNNVKETMSFEVLLIYIITGAVLAILLIFVIVCCCCCCRQRRKAAQSKNTTPSEEPVNPLSIYDTAPFDKNQISGPFYDAPPNGFDKPIQVQSSNEYQPSLPAQTFARPESVLIPGTDDMASTHL
ncbi:hypothetical protein BSL78_07004 [Apostichopus japonicus]|uniref:Uncharacterized protein n=1 Tax=Stichopus japonicus TaxID=307972 RepID=A0A2G8L785_STIJA|nr:hypothetical protein BSL78_07004 [Apostichopus japonicus]